MGLITRIEAFIEIARRKKKKLAMDLKRNKSIRNTFFSIFLNLCNGTDKN